EGLANSWQTLVAAELFASSEGLGYLMAWGRQLFQLDLVITAMIVVGAIGLPLGLLVAWEVAAHTGLVRALFLPPLEALAARAWTEIVDGELSLDIAMSLARDLAGFAIAAVIGVPLGLALGLSRLVERVFGPTFSAYRQIALFAWVPLISMWFGTGEEAKIAF